MSLTCYRLLRLDKIGEVCRLIHFIIQEADEEVAVWFVFERLPGPNRVWLLGVYVVAPCPYFPYTE